ncbi:MAG: NADP-dependent isocitrate dehydrogenase, partial [Planctomycetales bacterium]|nr:NADP-dependent isocitrate dehydrogenase [Planctomycetales bacterium]
MTDSAKIIYTLTDEAPALATRSLLPIISGFTRSSGVVVEAQDISLAGRILANFPDFLRPEQRVPDALGELGELAKTPQANIIKLPNISASIPQLIEAIVELREHGFPVPEFPEEPQSEEQKEIRSRYARVLGSAVNPVLREGNSDRRVAASVKEYAKKNPHSMGAWSAESKTHVASMSAGDFYASERSHTMTTASQLRIELKGEQGHVTVLKEKLNVQAGEIIDATVLSCRQLCDFLLRELEDARAKGLLVSVHLKATMMKVSDPIIFGHAVATYLQDLIAKHAESLKQIGFNPNNGIGDLENRLAALPADKADEIHADLRAAYAKGPSLAMVDSDKGITNLHVPSDIIIDASMPAAIRASGKMWGPDGKLADTKAIIPDRCYAGIYQATIDDCKQHGAFDPATMGSVANVGLMAQKAEEYG